MKNTEMLNAERRTLRARVAGLRMERDGLHQMIHSPFSPFLPRYNAVRAEIATISARLTEIREMLGEPNVPYRKIYSDIYR